VREVSAALAWKPTMPRGSVPSSLLKAMVVAVGAVLVFGAVNVVRPVA
jgi:hypothetical protein